MTNERSQHPRRGARRFAVGTLAATVVAALGLVEPALADDDGGGYVDGGWGGDDPFDRQHDYDTEYA